MAKYALYDGSVLLNGVAIPLVNSPEMIAYNQWLKEGNKPDVLELSPSDLRKREYATQGVTAEALIFAVAEKESGRPDELTALLAKREQIKIDFPDVSAVAVEKI